MPRLFIRVSAIFTDKNLQEQNQFRINERLRDLKFNKAKEKHFINIITSRRNLLVRQTYARHFGRCYETESRKM